MTNQSILLIKHYAALIKIDSFDNSVDFIEEIAQNIISDLGLKVVKKFSHFFRPSGITLGFILAESHLLIHAWPEFGVIHLDLAICSDRSKEEFKKSFSCALSRHDVQSIRVKVVNFD